MAVDGSPRRSNSNTCPGTLSPGRRRSSSPAPQFNNSPRRQEGWAACRYAGPCREPFGRRMTQPSVQKVGDHNDPVEAQQLRQQQQQHRLPVRPEGMAPSPRRPRYIYLEGLAVGFPSERLQREKRRVKAGVTPAADAVQELEQLRQEDYEVASQAFPYLRLLHASAGPWVLRPSEEQREQGKHAKVIYLSNPSPAPLPSPRDELEADVRKEAAERKKKKGKKKGAQAGMLASKDAFGGKGAKTRRKLKKKAAGVQMRAVAKQGIAALGASTKSTGTGTPQVAVPPNSPHTPDSNQ